MTSDLDRLVTEGRLADSLHLDLATTEELVHIMNRQDQQVAQAVGREAAQIARAIDLIAARMKEGGRLIYVGSGTSGRMGLLDASEIPPTFGVSADLVQGVIAGGWQAVFETRDGAEDSAELGVRDISARAMAFDTVVGIAASGRTPYTLAALKEARRRGCLTVAVTCNPDSPMAAAADVAISPVVGPEVIMGSTRLKAGTAQKLVLNTLSTGVMVRLGKVYTNLMVDMQPSNEKLKRRAIHMVMLAAEVTEADAVAALARCDMSVKSAVVVLRTGVEPGAAALALERAEGSVSRAIELAAGGG